MRSWLHDDDRVACNQSNQATEMNGAERATNTCWDNESIALSNTYAPCQNGYQPSTGVYRLGGDTWECVHRREVLCITAQGIARSLVGWSLRGCRNAHSAVQRNASVGVDSNDNRRGERADADRGGDRTHKRVRFNLKEQKPAFARANCHVEPMQWR